MIDTSPMPVAVQVRGYPHTLSVMWVPLHFDLRHYVDNGYEFPKARIAVSPLGAWVAGPLLQQVGL